MNNYYNGEPKKHELYDLIKDVVLSKNKKLNPELITPESNFVKNLEFDSLGMMGLVFGVEAKVAQKYKKPGFEIPIDKAGYIQTVDDAVTGLYQILYEK